MRIAGLRAAAAAFTLIELVVALSIGAALFALGLAFVRPVYRGAAAAPRRAAIGRGHHAGAKRGGETEPARRDLRDDAARRVRRRGALARRLGDVRGCRRQRRAGCGRSHGRQRRRGERGRHDDGQPAGRELSALRLHGAGAPRQRRAANGNDRGLQERSSAATRSCSRTPVAPASIARRDAVRKAVRQPFIRAGTTRAQGRRRLFPFAGLRSGLHCPSRGLSVASPRVNEEKPMNSDRAARSRCVPERPPGAGLHADRGADRDRRRRHPDGDRAAAVHDSTCSARGSSMPRPA